MTYSMKDFDVIKVLGQGSFGTVQLVRRIIDGKLLALKQVNMDKLTITQKNSALNEIRLLASIKSPYVISYEGSFFSSQINSLCLLMEYAEEGDLQSLLAKKIKNRKKLSQDFIWRTIIHLLQGLKTLHENKIVHRDLKSANIFYSNGVAKIGDMNVSTVSETTFYSTKTGTPYYTAPEIWRGEQYSTNCDIWSLGCIIYEMCALSPPFKAQNFPELFVQISKGLYQPLSEQYSEDIRTLVRMCLCVDARDRPSTMQILQSAILIKKQIRYKSQIDLSGQVHLLAPLKCPKILRFINPILPQSDQQQSLKKIVTEKCINDKGCNNSMKKLQSTKTIKIRRQQSCKVRNYEQNPSEPVPIKMEKCPSIHLRAEPATVVKNGKFRLRSCKRIGEKQNID